MLYFWQQPVFSVTFIKGVFQKNFVSYGLMVYPKNMDISRIEPNKATFKLNANVCFPSKQMFKSHLKISFSKWGNVGPVFWQQKNITFSKNGQMR